MFKPPLVFLTQLGLPELVKAKEKLSWLPLITLDAGLKQTIDFTVANKSLLGLRSLGR